MSTTRLYLFNWLEQRKGVVAHSTYLAYKHRAEHFVEFLGNMADAPMGDLTSQHIVRYRDLEASRASVSTANNGVKTL